MARSICLCGEVVWEFEGDLELVSHCHCGMCRKSHGVGYATYGAADAASFRFVAGEEHVSRYESSPGSFRSFCSLCGSKAPGVPTGDRIFVPLGNLEDDPGARPEMHIFVGSKAPWHPITGDLPQHDAFPPGWPDPGIVRPEPGRGGVRGRSAAAVCAAARPSR